MLFRFAPLRFAFVARESIHFPAGKSSNILRGAFGVLFRRLACLPQCSSADACPHRAECPYARLFEPASSAGPSGLADSPRPFVFRALHLDGRTFSPGEPFHFDLNLFDTQPATVDYLALTFAQLAREGLGPGRRKVELTAVHRLNELGQPSRLPFLSLDLTPPLEPVSRIRVRFITPTELKCGHQLAPRPEFPILAARIRDRLSTLRELYGPGPLPIDFRAFGERAAAIEMTRCVISHIAIERHSSRTGQTHPLGGFIGEAEYHGNLAEFLPYLNAARWTGVGRQTVWGKGHIEAVRS